MRLCEVIGNVVAARQHPAFEGRALMLVRPINADGGSSGPVFIAVDAAQAGAGDRVLVVSEGNGAAQVLGRGRGPIRSVIVGVVDAAVVESTARFKGSS